MSDDEKPASDAAAELPVPFRVEVEQLDRGFVEAVVQHINRKAVAPNDACPVCGSPLNMVADLGFKIAAKEAHGAVEGGREMPLLATVCRDCGFTRFFNRIVVEALLAQKATDVQAPPASDKAPEQGAVDAS